MPKKPYDRTARTTRTASHEGGVGSQPADISSIAAFSPVGNLGRDVFWYWIPATRSRHLGLIGRCSSLGDGHSADSGRKSHLGNHSCGSRCDACWNSSLHPRLTRLWPQRSAVHRHRRSCRPTDDAHRSLVGLENFSRGLYTLPCLRYLEAVSNPPTGAAARGHWYRGG